MVSGETDKDLWDAMNRLWCPFKGEWGRSDLKDGVEFFEAAPWEADKYGHKNLNKMEEANKTTDKKLNISDVMKRYQEIRNEYSECMSNYIKTGSNIYLDRAKEIEIIFDFFKR